MKKWIHATENLSIQDIQIDKIISVVLVDDVRDYYPKDKYIFADERIDYTAYTRQQLLQLPKREFENISNIRVLRKLDVKDLNPMQKRIVEQANKENFQDTIKKVKEILTRLKNCHAFHIDPTAKNDSFVQEIFELGGSVTDIDARNIIHSLHVKDYSYSTLSYLDKNWNSLLMIFGYNRPYTFKPIEGDPTSKPVTIESADLYIKIDVETSTRNGYTAMSFHHPDFKLNYPYKDYPIDKE